MPEMHAAPQKAELLPSVAGGALWVDQINGKLFSFGGYQPSSDPISFQTWTYDESDYTWSNISTEGDAVSYVAHGMSTVSADAGVAYYLGGYHDSHTDVGWSSSRIYTSNLVMFDMVNRKYSNSTGPDSIGRGEGIMTFIPASTSGLLVYFGGIIQDTDDQEVHGASMSVSGYRIVRSETSVLKLTGHLDLRYLIAEVVPATSHRRHTRVTDSFLRCGSMARRPVVLQHLHLRRLTTKCRDD